MIESQNVRFSDDDVWVGRTMISKCGGDDSWWLFGDDDLEKEFETLEQAVAFCLEQSHE